MERVCATVKETIFLGGWLNSKAYCIEIVNSAQPLRVTLNVGDGLSLHAGAAGKTLLAFLPDEDRENILKTYVPVRHTRKTIIDISELREQLVEIQKKELWNKHWESYHDIAAVGVPIFVGDGKVVASICCAGLVLRFSRNRVRSIAAVLKEAANDISVGLGLYNRIFKKEVTIG